MKSKDRHIAGLKQQILAPSTIMLPSAGAGHRTFSSLTSD
jgi:hypothetical protein